MHAQNQAWVGIEATNKWYSMILKGNNFGGREGGATMLYNYEGFFQKNIVLNHNP